MANDDDDIKISDYRIEFISKTVTELWRLKYDKWQKLHSSEEAIKTLKDFFSMELNNLYISLSTSYTLTISSNCLKNTKNVLKILYFIKRIPGKPLMIDMSIKEVCQTLLYGEISSNMINNFNIFLHEVAVPILLNSNNHTRWPYAVKEDIVDHVQKLQRDCEAFFACTNGQTILPLPNNSMSLDGNNKFWDTNIDHLSASSFGRKVVYAIETVIIEWVHQIDLVLNKNSADLLINDSSVLPLVEIDFWNDRLTNLELIYNQLTSDKIRKMGKILEISASVYFSSYKNLFKDVVKALIEAKDITIHLKPFQNYVEDFEQCDFESSKRLFEPILHTICLIWANCKHYCRPNRIIVLLQEFCNLIMKQCTDFLSPEELFKGEVEDVIVRVKQALKILVYFKQTFLTYRESLTNYFKGDDEPIMWKFTNDLVFFRYDAFVNRIEIVYHLLHSCLEFSKLEKIEFGGWRGTILSYELQLVAKEFQKVYSPFSNITYNPVNLNDESFLNDNCIFLEKEVGLNKKLANIYQLAFFDSSGLESIFKLVAIYSIMIDRPFIKDAIESTFPYIVTKINKEIDDCKEIYDLQMEHFVENNRYFVHKNMPLVSGALKWSHELQSRLVSSVEQMKFINSSALDTSDGVCVLQKYNEMLELLRKFNSMIYEEWECGVDEICAFNLKQNIITRLHDNLLEVNFDPNLISILREVKYLEMKPSVEQENAIPDSAKAIYADNEQLRKYINKLQTMVSWYNFVRSNVLHFEIALIEDRLEKIDKYLIEAESSINWKSENLWEYICKGGEMVKDLYDRVVQSKANLDAVLKILEELTKVPLFERSAEKHETLLKLDDREERLRRRYGEFADMSAKIHKLVEETRLLFEVRAASDSWRAYLDYWDELVVDGLVHVINTSLDYLLEQTELRTDQLPLFESRMELDANSNEVIFSPQIEYGEKNSLYNLIESLLADIFRQMSHISRVAPHQLLLSKEDNNYQAAVERIGDLHQARHDLMNVRVRPAMQQACEYHERFSKFAYLWTDNREEFLQQFLLYGRQITLNDVVGDLEEKAPTLTQFKEQIDTYEEMYQEINNWENSVTFLYWFRLDVRPFKQSVLDIVKRWSFLFKQHLIDYVKNSLHNLEEFISVTDKGLSIKLVEGDYEGLVAVMGHLAAQRERQVSTDEMFEPIQQTIDLLKSYGQQMPPEIYRQLEDLPEKWSNTKKISATIRQSLAPLQNHEVNRIRQEALKFDTQQHEFRTQFKNMAALFYTCETPYIIIDQWSLQLFEIERRMTDLVESARLFEVNVPDYKMVKLCHKELIVLKSLWDQCYIIQYSIIDWQKTQWKRVDVDQMDLDCKKFSKELRTLDSAARSWDVYLNSEIKVKNMLASLHAVTELRNSAIRDRHWAQLMEATGVHFLMTDETTLAELLSLNLHKYEEEVHNIVEKAVKEMSMEKVLKELDATWSTLELEHEIHSRTGLTIIKINDEIIETLEDNQSQLQNMLTSKHVSYFLKEVRQWVTKLSTADQVINIYMEVLRTWTNLESIFIGSEDIRRQLPDSADLFERIDVDFKCLVSEMVVSKNVVQSTGQPRLFQRFESMQKSMSVCEKALQDYMETKRLAFPRFYFVSQNDLLDILSHGNEPEAVMRHLTKLFDSMAKLKFQQDKDGRNTKTSTSMWSADGEFVDFFAPVNLDGQVEIWLARLLDMMRQTMRSTLSDAVISFEEKARDQWIFDFPAQVALTGSQIGWATETNLAFSRLEEGFEGALKEFSKKLISQLNALISMLIGELSTGDRQKIMTICTIDVHNRDVVTKLINQRVENAQAFTWLSQLRHRWDEEKKNCFGNICDAQFLYYHEYLGNTPRLVITPLTDRCYITLTQSLHLYMSGAPAGPAGTGKTETTKDLGRALGMMVYVFNCSEQMDYRSIGNIYKGLAQSGAWGCFDEFNRISVEVLSVVAVQVKSIQDALKLWSEENNRFHFLGESIVLEASVGIFITMNPGYAGRTELPENLKALFRPCAMVVPDFDLICEIMLVAEGFLEARLLARKFITLYELNKELLSKQDHYDWGLRAIKSVLVVAGALKRADPSRPENEVLMRALRDFNVPKIYSDDLPIFMGLIGDLFPSMDVPRKRDIEFEKEVRKAALDKKLQPEESFILKVVQLEELFAVRHSVFIVGNAGTGKSQVWKTLNRTYQNQKKRPVAVDLNPKAVTNDELYGIINPSTREWKDGLFSVIMRDLSNLSHNGPKWIVLDGDIDPMWIESLNTVMDDNKVLTLASNERITLTSSMRLLFEISHLRTATPATVSRAGILYINPGDLGWQPFVTSWISLREAQTEQANLTVLFDKYVSTCLEAMRTKFKKVTPVVEIAQVQMLCNLLDCLLRPEHGISSDASKEICELYFVFACIWAFGGCTFQDQLVDHRVEFSRWFVTEFKTIKFPKDSHIFDFYIDYETKKLEPWTKRVEKFVLDSEIPLQATLVSTTETTRIGYFLDLLIANRNPVMLVGNAGTGKTVLMQQKLNQLAETSEDFLLANVPFNFYTTSEMLQRVLEKPLEKKSGRIFAPQGNRRLIYFIDDLNMPEVDKYFTVQPHTLIRQHLDYNHWYDRSKLTLKEVKNTQYVACMNPTAGSFTIDPRLLRHFAVFAMSMPGQDALQTIYTSILGQHFLNSAEFCADVRKAHVTRDIVDATLALHQKISSTFLPTAIRFHYNFNLRDISNIFQGMLYSTPDCLSSRADVGRLWLHECERVYCDKLVDADDIEKYEAIVKEIGKKNLQDVTSSVGEDFLWKKPNLYCHYAVHVGDCKYTPIQSFESITNILTEVLDGYNEINASMNLVLFQDAICHILRITRILSSPRGNALLVGVGGSGKQSLSRLAAFLCNLDVFQITLRKGYGIPDLKNDLAQLYIKTGQKSVGMVFLLTDAQIADEKFLVLVNDLLASGDIPDLFSDDEIENICGAVRNEVKGLGLLDSRENCWRFFIDRVRLLLKVVLCFSPVGDTLRVRARKFPSLVSNTSVDWFHAWPEPALVSVSIRFLVDVHLLAEEQRQSTADFMAFAHGSVNDASESYLSNDRRYNYTTPKSFLEMIKLYRNLLEKKSAELTLGIDRLENGIRKLESTSEQVDNLKARLAEQELEVTARESAANEILSVVSKDTARVYKEKAVADAEEEKVAKVQDEVGKKREDCAKDLARAEPALVAAEEALKTLNKDNLTEMKSFTSPPSAVVNVMSAVVVLLSRNGVIPRDRGWKAAKQIMINVNHFLESLLEYDKDNIHENCLKAVKEYINKPDFNPDTIRSKSSAAAGLCSWVINILRYYDVYREVKPKRDALAQAEHELSVATNKLNIIRDKVSGLETSLAKLTADFEQATIEKIHVQREAATTAKTIELANRLVSGLASENDRWGNEVKNLKIAEKTLPGDVLITAAFVSYVGYFTKKYRQDLLETKWIPYFSNFKCNISISDTLNPINLLTNDAIIAAWNNEGLPNDRMSIENATILTTCERWPLLVDPQFQCLKWIKNRYGSNLKVIHLGQKGYLDVIEEAVASGDPVLIENIEESIDPVLDPLLGRNTTKRGRAIYIGDKEINYNPNFRLFIHTKLANPHYKPEMQAQTTLINFTVTRDGLEDQLLADVVQKEKPELEELKSELTRQQNDFKITLKNLEDALLARLSAAEGNFLGDYALVENLENNKATAIDIEKKVIEGKQTEIMINRARERFRPCAARASLIFFIMNDLWMINRMYKFSLKAFSVVFKRAIESAEASEDEDQRVKNILDSITYSVFVYTTRGLFEKDKLIFTTQMTFQIMLLKNELDLIEFDFLLRFPVVPNVTSPVNFLTNVGWGGIKALVNLESNEFRNLDNDIVGSAKRWQKFAESESPENERFPQEWKNKNDLQRLCMMRAIRPDRMTYAIKNFIKIKLGEKYVENRQEDFANSFRESGSATPVFFILSPGVDPLKEVESLGRRLGFTQAAQNFHNISLGQGQEIVAENALRLGASEGHWVVLQNIHLVAKWLPLLEQLLDSLGNEGHTNFRVFISAEPAGSPETHIIPQGVLESSIKITNEPPTGMMANLHKAFANFDQETVERCSRQVEFNAILFALCYFHAVVSERRKFGPIGWNRSYPFNNGDLTISVDVLYNYMEANSKVPWEDLRYLFGEIMYGGHITDDWDRRLCRSYLTEYMQPELVDGDLALAPGFSVPPLLDYKGYRDYIDEMLPSESPYLYGLHPNAEIEFLTSTSNELFRTVFEMQPHDTGSGTSEGVSKEETIRSCLEDLLERMPDSFVMAELLAKVPPESRTPFIVVALQEAERMNTLLFEMRRSLKELELGLKGELTITAHMENLAQALFLDQVPESWSKKAYPSLMPLGLWYGDLQIRVRELETWVSDFQLPGSVWLGGLFNPQSFLTAIMQQMARKNEWPLDKMCIQVEVTKRQRDEIGGSPREGAYVHGLYMEGALWDSNAGVAEAKLMDLSPSIPVVFIKAVPVDRQDLKNTYACPVYKTKQRGPTFVWTFHLKTKERPIKWILAGVALLLQN